MNIMFEQT